MSNNPSILALNKPRLENLSLIYTSEKPLLFLPATFREPRLRGMQHSRVIKFLGLTADFHDKLGLRYDQGGPKRIEPIFSEYTAGNENEHNHLPCEFINPSFLDLRRHPVPSSFESRVTVDAQGANRQFDENEYPFAEDDNHGNFDPLPYTPCTTLLDLPALDAEVPQTLQYVEEPGGAQVQYGLYQAHSVSIPRVEVFQHHHHHPTVQILPEQPEPQPVAQPYICSECQDQFRLPCKLNLLMLILNLSAHMKSHTLPSKCPISSCKSLGFQYLKDLKRHITSIHPELNPNAEIYFCDAGSCKHSRTKRKGFPRKDNCERHKKKCKHRIQQM
ncbi:putative zinc finger transcription factor ace1 protein [Botrytis fragariae]|uniref:Putative zinc finger transcription factor ace1 protein n=1 Tax=Botrytis fragariae TaxID=1964551 RepID=A0A8H6EK66_9HELO|nr:putative zinc finger transcription factor ace1 protein [Botrytis fragariae]KAF5875266.1 putative zinc finger transcription factor ace1 protein [Botrytis fragariae]